jgi:transcriptional regulator with XRE-family HTH domain
MQTNDTPLLGQVLRDARQRAGVSQKQLAIRTGIAAPSLSRIENGRESPSFERLATCLEALGFEPALELHPLAGSQADPVHLAAEAELTPAQRLESLFEWMRFGDSLARAQLKPLAPRDTADDA